MPRIIDKVRGDSRSHVRTAATVRYILGEATQEERRATNLPRILENECPSLVAANVNGPLKELRTRKKKNLRFLRIWVGGNLKSFRFRGTYTHQSQLFTILHRQAALDFQPVTRVNIERCKKQELDGVNFFEHN